MIEVSRAKTDTERELWTFQVLNWYSDDVYLKLSRYAKQTRESRRHKFKNVALWDSHDERYYRSNIKRNEVPEPEDVILEAIAAVKITYKPLEPIA